MVTVQDVFAFLDAQAPVRYQMDFDNAGFLAGNPQSTVRHILVALDITDDVIEEAIETGAQLIVSHHPLIFKPLKRVTADDLTGRKILRMAATGPSAVCMHTNLDIAEDGVNDSLMVALDAEVTGILEPAGTDDSGRPLGCGRVGLLRETMEFPAFLQFTAARLHANGLRYCASSQPVKRLAVCGGSGGDMLELAQALGCDTFVTADIKYDRFLAAKELGMNLIDADHFCTENVVIPPLAESLRVQFPELTVTVSQRHTQTAQFYMP